MIPYLEFSSVQLGPLTIHVWGFMVASGLLVALFVGRRIARKRGLDPNVLMDLAIWVMVGALIFGRVIFVLFYGLSHTLEDPLWIFRVWEGGMSSFGGYLGAALGAWLFARRRKIPLRRHVEVGAFVLPIGYGIGRLGCFLIHDHPGVLTDFFLAVDFPGGARLDHGLLLSLTGFGIFALFLIMWRRGWEIGADRWRYLPALLIIYGIVRIILDFLRAWDLPNADARYLYLTPAQYGAMVLVGVGVWMLVKREEVGKIES
ncbi:MAG: prolipoprotein diacylglyceryl transferase [Patescibacteria group bacterium]|nr:prolipoprotein diacylglyceryl transferase [Patescibacteria group bacterium]